MIEPDISERLSAWSGFLHEVSHDLREAADEIDRLRAELRTYTGDGHTLGEHLAREAT